ncbi:MAG: NFACT family protein [Clostridia bacterium]|nr:NFACT family protein [Clostridia bacterium]
MSYDGMVTHGVAHELNHIIVGGKIDKIHQPERDEIILQIRTQTGTHRLLLSANASHPRVHLTKISRENPMTPPMLCMLMRKHFQGNKILKITQEGFDRILRIETEGRNEMGDLCHRFIVVEIMGRHSNIILLDENNRIMDSAKHVDFTVSAVRQILPGLFYEAPPTQEKLSPDNYSLLDLMTKLDNAPEDTLLDKFLLSAFTGLSPLLAREIVYRFCQNTKVTRGEVNTASFLTETDSFLKEICANQYKPTLVISQTEKKPTAFSCMRLTQYEGGAALEGSESISAVIDAYYEKRAQKDSMNQRMGHLYKLVQNNIERCEKKLVLHRENLKKSQDRETYKIYGDLITANLYRLSGGMRTLEAENYFSENLELIQIPLQEDLTPSQNAQRYYKLYTKAKMTELHATEEIAKAEEEKSYLESVLESLEKAETPADLAEIKGELMDEGYIPKTTTKQAKSQKKSEPMRYLSSDGLEILVGRNNKQNDELTIRMAYSTDWWFHTKEIPGSHVIVRTKGEQEIPDNTVLEAAALAAYYSKAQNSSKVPVDYTTVKNVKKPNGAKPGMVIYDHYYTLYIDPKLPNEG